MLWTGVFRRERTIVALIRSRNRTGRGSGLGAKHGLTGRTQIAALTLQAGHDAVDVGDVRTAQPENVARASLPLLRSSGGETGSRNRGKSQPEDGCTRRYEKA